MDSQRTQIQKGNPRIGVLFPEWPSEKIRFDDVELAPASEDLDDELRAIEKPVLLTQKPLPAWQDIDLHSAL